MAISNATKAFMTKELNKMGANTINVQMNSNEELDYRDYLRFEDMAIIEEGVDGIEYVAGAKVFFNELREEDGTRDAIIQGVTNAY